MIVSVEFVIVVRTTCIGFFDHIRQAEYLQFLLVRVDCVFFHCSMAVFASWLSRFLSRRRAAALMFLFRRTASLALGWFLAKFRLTPVRGPVVVRS